MRGVPRYLNPIKVKYPAVLQEHVLIRYYSYRILEIYNDNPADIQQLVKISIVFT